MTNSEHFAVLLTTTEDHREGRRVSQKAESVLEPPRSTGKPWVTAPFIFWLSVSIWAAVFASPFVINPTIGTAFLFLMHVPSLFCLVLAVLYLCKRGLPKKYLPTLAIVISLSFVAAYWRFQENLYPNEILGYLEYKQEERKNRIIRVDRHGNVIQPR